MVHLRLLCHGRGIVHRHRRGNAAEPQAHGGVPINHMMVVRTSISESRPDVIKEIYRMLQESRRVVPPSEGGLLDPWRFGVEANRHSLEVIIDYSFRQKLIPRKLSVDELFDDCTRALA